MRDEIEAAATFLTRLVNKNLSTLQNSATLTPPASDSSSTTSSSSTSPPLTTSLYDGTASSSSSSSSSASSTSSITSNNSTDIHLADKTKQFRQCLTQALFERFHNHWFPEQPTKGQAYRCIRLNEFDRYDPILKSACSQCGVDYKDLQLPVELTLWVDPDEVTCRFGEHTGSHCIVAKFRQGEVKENNINQINIEEFGETTTKMTPQFQYNQHDYRNTHRLLNEDELYARLPEMCNKKLDILNQEDLSYEPSLTKFLYHKKMRDHQNVFVVANNAEYAGQEERVQQLMDLSGRRPVIRFNSEKFKKFLVSPKSRDYSIIVMMTALNPQRSCHICRQAGDEYTIVAQSYKASPNYESRKLFFALVDYDDGSEVFNLLNIHSAPGFLFYGPKTNIKKPEELNIQRLGFGADIISRWVTDKTGMTFKIVRPPNFSGPIIMVTLGILIVSILYLSRNSLNVVYNRNIWALVSVMIVFLMTSGQMWNNIRGAPLMQRTGKGQVNYIHGSSSGQYVIESYMVMLINMGVALGIGLTTEALRINSKIEGRRRKLCAIIGVSMLAVFYSLLLSTFRRKSYGYPYRLLF